MRTEVYQDDALPKEMNDLTHQIIGAALQVMHVLGYGFLEKVYENALVIQLRRLGLKVQQQVSLRVYFEGECVGEYVADIMVNDCVIIEMKAVEEIGNAHLAQCLNYLKATNMRVCILMNFGRTKLEWKRVVR
jgi:GxxExxY protein